MIYTLTGDNTYALKAALDTRVQSFIAEHGDLALERIDGQEASIESIREAVHSLPFLASKKMVVLREPSKQKQFADEASELLKDVPETTDVLLVEPKLDKRQKYYTFVSKNTEFTSYDALDTSALVRWLVAYAQQQSGDLSSADARYLVQRIGPNQLMLASEIDKLITYNKSITRQSIDLLVEPTPQSTIFELIEASFAGNTAQALKLYDEQRALKVEPQQIIALLGWQLHILAIIVTAGDRTNSQIAKEAKLNPYVVGKSTALARSLSFRKVADLITELAHIDAASKSTNQNTDDALKLFIISLAS